MSSQPIPDLVLSPATRLLWRGTGAVHLELGDRAAVVAGLRPDLVAHLASNAPPRRDGPPLADAETADALTRLAADGFLWSRPADSDDPRWAPPRARLAGELTALSAIHGARAAELLAARRHYAVEVHGTSSAAAHLAAVLAAAGIGRVRCLGSGAVRLGHAVPGGILAADEGDEFAAAAARALDRAAPDVDLTPLPPDEVPNLVVLADDAPVGEDHRAALHAAGAPHLRVTVAGEHGTVGPLVLPGLTSCLRCADLHRRDRDPAWPALAVQLTVPRRYGPHAATAVAVTTVGLAAGEALTFLDGGTPATLAGTLEMRAPDWRVRRRTRPPHPSCDCGLAPAAADAPG